MRRNIIANFASAENTGAAQKDSFYPAKGLVLECKRTPSALQKDSFWKPKGLLLKEAGVVSLPYIYNKV